MTKRMLIDATHPEETRVAIVSGNRLEEFDYETTTKQQLKGNIYLAKVTRVEPSLQAAFVEYGGNRHGFLAFSEIHPDYYRIPVADREDLVEDQSGDDDESAENGDSVEEIGGDEGMEEAVQEAAKRRPRLKRHYKIQEVIKRRQVLLIQVLKEERGTKGAALTTYLSMAGRYCVLMPNTSRGGGVSRKITSVQDRKRLKTILADLDLPDGMAVILRTAGGERSKAEIRRDFDYIRKLWDDIREKTLKSTAPALIHEEANLIRRAIRDLYDKEIEEILVAGDTPYRVAKDFMKAMIPSHAKKVQPYKDDASTPLFHRYKIESQLDQVFEPTMQLRSGGSIVLQQTEALVSIDVNSGRSTRERHIEDTAVKTNTEAAEEIARQLRLRDLAGLIVIDFIDMEDNRNQHAVERKLKESLRRDRARIQVGRISPFGLLEMSRQRLRPSILEAMSQSCPTCGGLGHIPSTESAALRVLRALEEEGLRKRSDEVSIKVPPKVALYILNNKRKTLADMEEAYGLTVNVETDDDYIPPNFTMVRIVENSDGSENEVLVETTVEESDDSSRRRPSRKRRSRGKRNFAEEDGGNVEAKAQDPVGDAASAKKEKDKDDEDTSAASPASDDGDETDKPRRRRKRGRRGGRRRRGRDETAQSAQETPGENEGQGQSREDAGDGETPVVDPAVVPAVELTETAAEPATAEPETEVREAVESDAGAKSGPAKRPRARRKAKSAKPRPAEQAPTETAETAPAGPVLEEPVSETPAAAPDKEAVKPKPRRAPRKKAAARKKADPVALEPASAAPVDTAPDTTPIEMPPVATPAEPAAVSNEPPKPKRSGWWNKVAE